MKSEKNANVPIKKSPLPLRIFFIIWGAQLLIAGLQIGLIVLGMTLHWPAIFQTHLLLFYWVVVAAIIVLYIKKKIYVSYDLPLQNVSRATAKVAKGDFSVRIPVVNPPEKYDYMDVMISDLNKMIEELGSTETLRTDFIANVSHELKTPLSVMQNYAVMLQSPDLDEAHRMEYAKAVSQNCRRLTSLITNILKLNKLENQQIFPRVAPYDLGEQIRECVLAFEDVWSAKDISLEANIADGIMITVDGELLALVWNNLLSNAIKFTQNGGTISVEVYECGKEVRVCVSDTGCGMDSATQKHIFEKFYQGDTSHAAQGNGLGLALASRVVTIANGKISVKSEQKKGSCFTVTLPLEH